ncbi:MAG TPA: LD-carboxypeptidase [Chitinophagaceae bacterium]|nr:LD-carboxypeptidase [Chitinophagaceae bacterium]
MNRDQFLKTTTGLLALTGWTGLQAAASGGRPAASPRIPPHLRPGQVIGITCPAGYITAEEIAPAVSLLESWGFVVKTGQTLGARDYTFGGTDAERAGDFQRFLDDPQVHAILCARGGYGAVRIIDRLNWERFVRHPKWILGFSDITVFHAHLNRRLGIASLHCKMCNSFPVDWAAADAVQADSILSIRRALTGERLHYEVASNPFNRPGTASGILVGGNLKTLESLSATPSDLATAGKILFLEDTGEYAYSIDRMFWHLRRSGKLAGLRGLILGGFRIKTDADTEDFGRSLEQIVLDQVKRYRYPVCFDFPVGHQKNNFALKCGVLHRLEVGAAGCRLTELR